MIRKSRKGISPIIATVLLILIAIATGVIIYAFATGWVGSRITSSGPSSMISIDTASISYTNDDTKYNVTVYVRNLGATPVNISGLYLVDLSSDKVLGASTSINTQINPNQVAKISSNLTLVGNLTSGYSYQIKVTTTDGSYATTTVVYHK